MGAALQTGVRAAGTLEPRPKGGEGKWPGVPEVERRGSPDWGWGWRGGRMSPRGRARSHMTLRAVGRTWAFCGIGGWATMWETKAKEKKLNFLPAYSPLTRP